MKYINKFNQTTQYEAAKEQLNTLKHFVAYDAESKKVYLKKPVTMNTILINQLESDPSRMISGDVNGEVIQWIRQNTHRVLAKKTGEGTMTYIELDDTNSNKYAADGSEAKTDGTEGDVFVKLPTFYYRGNDTNEDGSSGDNVEIKFADGPFEDSVKWDTNILIGAYELYKDDNNKLHSISNVMTTCDMSYNDMNNYAKNMGNGYQLIDWRMHCVIGCLFYALYGNTNSRKVLGRGMYETMENGYTNSIGMTDTVA